MPHCQECGHLKQDSEGKYSESSTFCCNACIDTHDVVECDHCCCWTRRGDLVVVMTETALCEDCKGQYDRKEILHDV